MSQQLALSVKGLSKTYSNGVKALKGIDFDVKAGDFYALLGPNGAGKSTLIGIISSLVIKNSGIVNIYGHNLDENITDAKRFLGIVPQEFNFNQFEKVEDIILNQAGFYGLERRECKEHLEYLLKSVDLWDKRKHAARMLSGGMKRRLMIARALIHKPKLLLLDEPTAGVDIEIRRSMWSFLKKLNESGTTIILTTHYLEEAEQLCRNIGIINHGELIENTSMAKLLSQLQYETIIFTSENKIGQLPTIENCKMQILDDFNFELQYNKEEINLSQVFVGLQKQEIVINSTRNKANRLEELFVRLTNEHNHQQQST